MGQQPNMRRARLDLNAQAMYRPPTGRTSVPFGASGLIAAPLMTDPLDVPETMRHRVAAWIPQGAQNRLRG